MRNTCEICKTYVGSKPIIIEVGERGDAKTGRVICGRCFTWAYNKSKRKRHGRKRVEDS
jgi:hypothetical protein